MAKLILASLFFIFLLIEHSQSHVILSTALKSEGTTWTQWKYCQEGTYIKGFRVKTDSKGKAQKSLYGIHFYCGPISAKEEISKVIGFGKNGEDAGKRFLSRKMFCEGPATGFQVQSKTKKKKIGIGVNNFRLQCSNFNETLQADIGEKSKGKWGDIKFCKDRQALCGAQFGVKHNKLYGMKVECCHILNQAETCKPRDKWDLLFEYDNTFGLHPATYVYNKRVGVKKEDGVTNVNQASLSKGGSISGSLTGEYNLGIETTNLQSLQGSFVKKLGGNRKTSFEWHKASSNTWEEEKSTAISITVDPGYRIRIYQVLGVCGPYTVRPDFIEQTGTFYEAKRRGTVDGDGNRRLSFGSKVVLSIISAALLSSQYLIPS